LPLFSPAYGVSWRARAERAALQGRDSWSCPDSPLRGPGGPRLVPPFPGAMAAVHRRFGRLTNWRGSIAAVSAATTALLP